MHADIIQENGNISK